MIVGVIYTWLSLMSADKSSTERESEGLPLTQLPAETASTSAPTVLPPVTADRRATTLRANKCVICGFLHVYIPEISSGQWPFRTF